MSKIKDRHYFPGGNTSEGFFSFYDYIIDKKTANRIFCMKGGPGTGKSSLMKKIGKHYSNQGYSIEYHHCSSDNSSLDGVLINELKVCILDGTSPHIVDPKYPIAVDEVLNMGECLSTELVSKNKQGIIDISYKISCLFNRAYRFFASATSLYNDIEFYNQGYVNKSSLVNIKNDLTSKIIGDNTSSNYGSERHLFGTALTPNGIVSYLGNIVDGISNTYVLDGHIGTGKTFILSSIAESAKETGFRVEYYHTPLVHEKLEAIVIPELDVCIVSKNLISNLKITGTVIDINSALDKEIPDNVKCEIAYDYKTMMDLINKGLSLISDAHTSHDALEEYYISAMDFSKADAIYEDTIRKIDSYK